MLQTANCDPTEISISPASMTIVIPIAMSMVAALLMIRSREVSCVEKWRCCDGDDDKQHRKSGTGRDLSFIFFDGEHHLFPKAIAVSCPA